MRAAKGPVKKKPPVKVATATAKNRGGRPPLPPGIKLIQRSIRLSAANWDKIDKNGGLAWLREVIDAQ